MSAAKHSPGPWTAVQARNEHGDCYSRIVADREVDGACIAATITVPGDDREAMEADAADARLIAAAPDLLAALADVAMRACQDRIASGIGRKAAKDNVRFLVDALERIQSAAEAAIARAEGRAT